MNLATDATRAAVMLAEVALQHGAEHMAVRVHPKAEETGSDVCAVFVVVNAPELSERVRGTLAAWDLDAESKGEPRDRERLDASPAARMVELERLATAFVHLWDRDEASEALDAALEALRTALPEPEGGWR